MKLTLSSVLSFNGGYVDTAGYLALQGLFTAHVTGNFVTIGAALVFGTSGVVAKLLALPVFCMVIIVTRLVSFNLPPRWPVLETMLTLQLLLLLLAAVLAIAMGAFANGDGGPAIIAYSLRCCSADNAHDRYNDSDYDRYCGYDSRCAGGCTRRHQISVTTHVCRRRKFRRGRRGRRVTLPCDRQLVFCVAARCRTLSQNHRQVFPDRSDRYARAAIRNHPGRLTTTQRRWRCRSATRCSSSMYHRW